MRLSERVWKSVGGLIVFYTLANLVYIVDYGAIPVHIKIGVAVSVFHIALLMTEGSHV